MLHLTCRLVSKTTRHSAAATSGKKSASFVNVLNKAAGVPAPGNGVSHPGPSMSEPHLSEPPAPKELAAAGKARRIAGKLRFDGYKAGLQKVDQAHVEQVIQEASKGTAFYQKEQRREEARRMKVDAILKKAAEYPQLSNTQKQVLRSRVEALEGALEASRDVRRRFIHIDMDMFYAAVEEKKNPQLRGVPFGVGSLQMLSTTNYIARQYGVRSGMPGFIGRRLCPDLIIVPTDFASYRREAAIVHTIAARYDAQFVSLGLDELTMDVTKYLEEFPALTVAQVVNDFRDEVFAKTQLTCSGGIAPTPGLAKIASNVNKPNGQHEVVLLHRQDFLNYTKNLPLRKIPGIGYAQEMTLNALNIKTCGDLLKQKHLLAFLFKEKTFEHYLSVGLGLMGAQAHKQHEVRQSIGKEVSFTEPLASPKAFSKLFRNLLETCHAQCVCQHLYAQQLRLVLKYRTYDNAQFSVALPRPTNDLKLWLEAGKKLLLPHLDQYAELRLVGVRLQKLVSESAPLLPEHEVTNLSGRGQHDDVLDALAGEVRQEGEGDHRCALDTKRSDDNDEVHSKLTMGGNSTEKAGDSGDTSKLSSRVATGAASPRTSKRSSQMSTKSTKKGVKTSARKGKFKKR